MGERQTGAAARVRDYLRWKPRWRRSGGQIVVQSVISGVLFTVLMSIYDGLTDGWDEVSVTSVLFIFTFFTLLNIGFGFLFNPKQAPPESQSQTPSASVPPASRPGG